MINSNLPQAKETLFGGGLCFGWGGKFYLLLEGFE